MEAVVDAMDMFGIVMRMLYDLRLRLERQLFYKKWNYDRILYQINLQAKMRGRTLKKGETPNQFETELYDQITKIETQVLVRIQKLKSSSKSYVCEHFKQLSPECEPFNQNINYYDKFWKRFMINEIGKQGIVQFKEHNQYFSRKLVKIQSLFQQHQKLDPRSKKRKPSRLSENQKYQCLICSKKYSDEELLIIHMRVKHKEKDNVEEHELQPNPQQIYQGNRESE